MNGSNLLLFLLLFFIQIGCGGSKKTTKSKATSKAVNSSIQGIKTDVDTTNKTPLVQDTFSNSLSEEKKEAKNPFEKSLEKNSIQKKSEYAVVCILPFSSGEIWKLDLAKVDNVIPKEPKQTLQYYEGMHLAMQEWKNKGLPIHFYLYDNKKQDSATIHILEKIDLKNPPDILIAPFHTKQAQLVAAFAQKHKIPCFLPYNPSDKIANNNPYLFKTNPSLLSIYKRIYKEKTEGPDSAKIKFHFVFKDNVKGEYDLAKSFEKYTQSKIDTAQIRPDLDPKKVNFIVSNKNMKIIENIVRNRTNIYLLPSADDKYINQVLASIKPAPDYSFEIYGIPSWENSELLEKEHFMNKKAYIYTDYFIEEDSTEYEALNKTYLKLFGETLNDDVIRGYDFMNFIAGSLDKYGTNFPWAIQENEFSGLGTRLQFKPTIDKKGNVDNFENSRQFKLVFQEDRWVLETATKK